VCQVRGFKVIVAQVEDAIAAHPLVASAVVTTLGTDSLRRLVAGIVLEAASEGTPTVSTAELRRWLQTRLPPHAVPVDFRMITALPISTGAKLDRSVLPHLLSTALPLGRDESIAHAAPDLAADDQRFSRAVREATTEQMERAAMDGLPLIVGPSTEALANEVKTLFTNHVRHAVGSEVLISVNDDANFFELGGHSLAAMRLLAHVQRMTANYGEDHCRTVRRDSNLECLYRLTSLMRRNVTSSKW
jgi:hypothetical protein